MLQQSRTIATGIRGQTWSWSVRFKPFLLSLLIAVGLFIGLGGDEHGHDLGVHLYTIHERTLDLSALVALTSEANKSLMLQWVATVSGEAGTAFNPYLIFLFYSL